MLLKLTQLVQLSVQGPPHSFFNASAGSVLTSVERCWRLELFFWKKGIYHYSALALSDSVYVHIEGYLQKNDTLQFLVTTRDDSPIIGDEKLR